MTSFDGGALRNPLSADAVRAARFESRRRGFDPDDVRSFLNQVANNIQAADAERASLRAELHSAHAELDQLRRSAQGGQPGGQPEPGEISVHAVELLSQAQQIADSCVAEAEQYARDLVEAARGQYQDILHRAQQAAASSVRDLAEVQLDRGVSIPEIEYVRTYAKVAQVQLRSVLDALTQEVDKLGQIAQSDEYHPTPAPASEEISWQPDNLVRLNATRTAAPEPPGYSVEPYRG